MSEREPRALLTLSQLSTRPEGESVVKRDTSGVSESRLCFDRHFEA